MRNSDASDDITSELIFLGLSIGYAVQAVITGSPVGTLKLQASVDDGDNWAEGPGVGSGVVNWNDIPNTLAKVNGAEIISWSMDTQPNYKWARLIFTSTSGTGNITATVNIKGFTG